MIPLGEGLLDRIEVGAVGWQVNEGGATGLDRVAHTGDLGTAEIDQDENAVGQHANSPAAATSGRCCSAA